MSFIALHTDQAPAAIGTYSQATQAGDWVFLSGQIGLSPDSGDMVAADTEAQLRQIFKNIKALCAAAGGSLTSVVKFNVFLVDLGDFSIVNKIMEQELQAPFPARAAVEVSALPKNARVEIDAVLYLG